MHFALFILNYFNIKCLFDLSQPFVMTEDVSVCAYCDFKNICGKNLHKTQLKKYEKRVSHPHHPHVYTPTLGAVLACTSVRTSQQ